MDVIAHADAGMARRGMGRLGAGEVLRVGQFFKPFVALHQNDVMAPGPQYLRVVGRLARVIPCAMRRQDGVETESLRRLHAVQSGAVHSIAHDRAVATHQRICNRQSGDGARRIVQRGKQSAHDSARQEGPGGIMDQDDIRATRRRDRFQPCAHRPAAAVRPGDECRNAIAQQRARLIFLPIAEHDMDRVDAAMHRQRVIGMRQHGLAGHHAKLFGNVAARPAALAGCDDQRDDLAL